MQFFYSPFNNNFFVAIFNIFTFSSMCAFEIEMKIKTFYNFQASKHFPITIKSSYRDWKNY